MTTTAEVTTLAAEVHVLRYGARQVTASVWRQLDWEDPALVEPFGRVRIGRPWRGVDLVGRQIDTGALVRTSLPRPERDEAQGAFNRLERLPLIVLAG